MDHLPRDRTSPPNAPVLAALGTAAVFAAVAAQIVLDRSLPLSLDGPSWLIHALGTARQVVWPPLLLAIAGCGLWMISDRSRPHVSGEPSPTEARPAWSPGRIAALGTGLGLVSLTAVVAPEVVALRGLRLLSIGAEAGRTGNTFTTVGALLWAGGTILALTALAGRRRPSSPLRAERVAGALRSPHLWVLATIVVGAALLRFHDLAGLPREMTSDHTEKLLNVLDILRGERPVFLPQNGGREPLQFYWTAVLVAMGMPLSFTTLKLGMAMVSVATVPTVYLVGREVGGRRLGLAAAAVIALAPWHLQLTRAALRSPLSTLFSALALFLLLRGVRTGRRGTWIATGAVIGLGLYGYTGFRPMLVLAPALVVLKAAMGGRRRAVPATADLAAAAIALALVAVPMARYAVDQPQAFFHRTLTRAGSAERPLPRQLAGRFANNVVNAAGMFSVTSDRTWLQSPPGRPALETVGGALLLLGLVSAARRACRGSWENASMLAAVPVMLLASALALAFPVEVPHLARAAGALPAVAVLAAIPLLGVQERWNDARRPSIGRALVAVLLAMMAGGAVHRVFVEYRAGYDRHSLPASEGAAVARAFLAAGGDLGHVYLVGWPHGWDHRALAIELGAPEWDNALRGVGPEMRDAVGEAAAHTADPAPKLYLVGGSDGAASVEYLRTLYPGATATFHRTRVPGKEFWSVRVKGRRGASG